MVLGKLVCLLVVKPVSLGCGIAKGVIDFNVSLCWKFLVFTTSLVAFPARLLNAIQREKYLELQLHEMQIEFDRLVWENKDLEERLHRAIKDRKVMETLFEEVEEEHEKALSRIDLLENELQDLKEESMHLNEIRGKGSWDNYNKAVDRIDEGIPVYSYGDDRKGGMFFQVPHGGDSWGTTTTTTTTTHDSDHKASSNNKPPLSTLPITVSRDLPMLIESSALEGRRAVALYRSLFSSILSLLVGMIIWEADDPCMPLVAALFIVVGMSLGSVVQFFSTIRNKPASDAVALLSINWFILGTLTSPSLPRVARALAPHAVKFADRVIFWLGLSS